MPPPYRGGCAIRPASTSIDPVKAPARSTRRDRSHAASTCPARGWRRRYSNGSAQGGTRTRTSLRTVVFETTASTSCATWAGKRTLPAAQGVGPPFQLGGGVAQVAGLDQVPLEAQAEQTGADLQPSGGRVVEAAGDGGRREESAHREVV